MIKRSLSLAILLALLLALAPAAHAVTNTFFKTSSGSWNSTGNWSNGIPNSTSYAAYIGGSGTYTASLGTSGYSTGNLYLGTDSAAGPDTYGGPGAFNVGMTSSSYTFSVGTSSYIGYQNNGTLSITNGTVNNSGTSSSVFSYLGGYTSAYSSAAGTVNVSGAHATWSMANGLYTGYYGPGYLNITSGGTFSDTGFGGVYIGGNSSGGTGMGTVTVDGSGSKLNATSASVYVGYKGAGSSLTITNGATVSPGSLYLGYSSGAGGTVSLYSGVLSSGTSTVGYSGSGTVNVNSSSSTWKAGSMLTIGSSGTGSVNITNGAKFTYSSSGGIQHAYIGYNSGSSGTVTVDGSGSQWNGLVDNGGSALVVGNNGNGTLKITNGAYVTGQGTQNYFTAVVGNSSGSTGTVTVDGSGSAFTPANLWVGGTSSSTGTGVLHITNGASVTSLNTFNDWYSGTYVGSGGGSGTLDFGSSNGGTLTTGNLFASPSQITGAGTVYANGLVSDCALVFNSGSTPTVQLGSTTVYLSPNSTGNLSGSYNYLGVGYLGNGSLMIANGQTVGSFTGYLGYRSGSDGTGTVTGTGSTWSTSSSIYLGYSSGSTGSLSISNGGAVNVGYYLYVGNSGTGSLSVSNGGTVNDSGSGAVYIGNNAASAGTLTIDGATSTFNAASAPNFYVGNSGTGVLHITNGATVNCQSATTCVGSGMPPERWTSAAPTEARSTPGRCSPRRAR